MIILNQKKLGISKQWGINEIMPFLLDFITFVITNVLINPPFLHRRQENKIDTSLSTQSGTDLSLQSGLPGGPLWLASTASLVGNTSAGTWTCGLNMTVGNESRFHLQHLDGRVKVWRTHKERTPELNSSERLWDYFLEVLFMPGWPRPPCWLTRNNADWRKWWHPTLVSSMRRK